jgi:hypothetical protein
MLLEKKALTLDDLEAQAAFELPDRNLLGLITVIAVDVVDVDTGDILTDVVDITVKNNNIAVQVCAAVNAVVEALTALQLLDLNVQNAEVTCSITQTLNP